MLSNAIRQQARASLLSTYRYRICAISKPASLLLTPLQWPSLAQRTLSTSSVHLEFSQGFRKPKPPSSTLWVGNIPFAADEEELRQLFSPYGTVIDVRIGRSVDGRCRGFAHIEFDDVQCAKDAVSADQEDPLYLMNRDLVVDYAPPKIGYNTEPNAKLYVSNFMGSEEDLEEAFKEFSHNLTNVHLMKNPQNGESMMAGFAEFKSIEDATEAMTALNGREITHGSTFNIAYARQRPQRDERFGNSSSRSYGGDWGGRRRSSDYNDDGARRENRSRGGRGGFRSGRGGGGGGGFRSRAGGDESY